MIETVPAVLAHAAVLAEIHGSAADEVWDEAAFASFLEKSTISALLAMEAGTPRGFILVQRAADEAEVLMIATHPATQRKGIGKKLVVSVSEQLAHVGVETLFLEVAEDNTAARALYAACGMVQVGRRAGYYVRDVVKIDALLLRLDLVETKLRTR